MHDYVTRAHQRYQRITRRHRAIVLARIAPHFPLAERPNRSDVFAEARLAAEAVSDAGRRAEALAAIASQLSGEQATDTLNEARTAIADIPDKLNRQHYVLLQVISQLSGKQFSQTVFTALEGQANPSWIASWIADEVSDPDQLLGSALADMHDDKDRAAFIEAFAPHFSDRTFMDGLPAAMSIGDRHLRSQALDAMTTSMPLRLQEHAFSALRAFKDEQGRADGLMALLPHVLTASADSARRIIHSFHDARIRAEVNARAEALFAARPQETIDQATRILNYLFQDFRVGFASSTSDVAASLAVSLNTQQDTILRHLCVPRISSAALASRVALPAVRP